MTILRRILSSAFFVVIVALNASAQSSAPPNRIISISPVITEILFGVGAFDRVIAVSDYCLYPDGVKNLPRVGGWTNTNLEKVVSLRPDLILITDAQAPLVAESFQELKLRHIIIPTQSLDDAFTAINQIGRAVGNEARAASLVRDTRTALDTIRNKTKGLSKRRVLSVVDRTPGTLRELTVATPGSFLAELMEIAGGQLVTAPVKGGYITINKEALAALDPEIILDIVHTPGGRLSENEKAVWAAMPALRAVREGKVYPVRDEFILHTSQFVSQTVKMLAGILHPEVFPGGAK